MEVQFNSTSRKSIHQGIHQSQLATKLKDLRSSEAGNAKDLDRLDLDLNERQSKRNVSNRNFNSTNFSSRNIASGYESMPDRQASSRNVRTSGGDQIAWGVDPEEKKSSVLDDPIFSQGLARLQTSQQLEPTSRISFEMDEPEQLEGNAYCRSRGVLPPESKFRGYVDLCLLAITLYFSALLPIQIAFLPTERTAMFYVNASLDCLYAFDLVLNFFTSYRPSYEELGESGSEEEFEYFLVTDRKKIAIAYIKGRFPLDLFLSFPLLDLVAGANCCSRAQAEILRLPRFLKFVCRSVRAFRIIKCARVQIVLRPLKGHVPQHVEHLCQFAASLLLLVHWTACLFYAVASCDWSQGDCYFSEIEVLSIEACGPQGGDCVARSWLTAVQAVLLLVNGEAYPLKSHTSALEQVLLVTIIIAGTVVLGLVFGQVAITLSEANEQKRADAAALSRLDSNLKALHLDPRLRRQVVEYFQIQTDLYRPELAIREEAFPLLNNSLRGHVELYLKSTVITEIPLVADLVRDSKPAAMRVCTCLNLRTYLADDVVAHKHARASRMAILLVGDVARVYNDSRPDLLDSGPVVLFANALFIEMAVHAIRIVAHVHCEIYELSVDDYAEIQDEFPYTCAHSKALERFKEGLQNFAENDDDVVSAEDLSDDEDSEDELTFDAKQSKESLGKNETDADNGTATESGQFFFAARQKMKDPRYRALRRLSENGPGMHHVASAPDSSRKRGSATIVDDKVNAFEASASTASSPTRASIKGRLSLLFQSPKVAEEPQFGRNETENSEIVPPEMRRSSTGPALGSAMKTESENRRATVSKTASPRFSVQIGGLKKAVVKEDPAVETKKKQDKLDSLLSKRMAQQRQKLQTQASRSHNASKSASASKAASKAQTRKASPAQSPKRLSLTQPPEIVKSSESAEPLSPTLALDPISIQKALGAVEGDSDVANGKDESKSNVNDHFDTVSEHSSISPSRELSIRDPAVIDFSKIGGEPISPKAEDDAGRGHRINGFSNAKGSGHRQGEVARNRRASTGGFLGGLGSRTSLPGVLAYQRPPASFPAAPTSTQVSNKYGVESNNYDEFMQNAAKINAELAQAAQRVIRLSEDAIGRIESASQKASEHAISRIEEATIKSISALQAVSATKGEEKKRPSKSSSHVSSSSRH